MRMDALLRALRNGEFDKRLREIYPAQPLDAPRARIAAVVEGFRAAFPGSEEREIMIYAAPGRTELLGNHTDHQGGCVLAAAVQLDTIACVAVNEKEVVRIHSKGHVPVVLSTGDLAAREEERGHAAALVRGVAAGLHKRGAVLRGFDAYTETQVLRGGGLSSSAAFEVLVGAIMNDLSHGGMDAVEIAKLGQWAENVYYGKPCGLMDQMASAVGGVIGIDFADAATPKVRSCRFDWEREGYTLVLVNSGADHAELDAQYAAIPRQMRQIASALGGELLSQTKEEDFLSRRAELAALYGKRAANRAAHYYAETNRAAQGFAAAEEGNMREFLALSRASACSSEELLENITLDRPGGDRLKHAIDLARRAAGEEGAARVHGGGFAGTAQAWVPTARLETFICEVEAGFGAGSCLVVHPRSVGAGRIIG